MLLKDNFITLCLQLIKAKALAIVRNGWSNTIRIYLNSLTIDLFSKITKSIRYMNLLT